VSHKVDAQTFNVFLVLSLDDEFRASVAEPFAPSWPTCRTFQSY
jgi:hypothetical protein